MSEVVRARGEVDRSQCLLSVRDIILVCTSLPVSVSTDSSIDKHTTNAKEPRLPH